MKTTLIIFVLLFPSSLFANLVKCEKIVREECGNSYKFTTPQKTCEYLKKIRNDSEEQVSRCIKNLEEHENNKNNERKLCSERIKKSKEYKNCMKLIPPISEWNPLIIKLLISAGIFAMFIFRFIR